MLRIDHGWHLAIVLGEETRRQELGGLEFWIIRSEGVAFERHSLRLQPLRSVLGGRLLRDLSLAMALMPLGL